MIFLDILMYAFATTVTVALVSAMALWLYALISLMIESINDQFLYRLDVRHYWPYCFTRAIGARRAVTT